MERILSSGISKQAGKVAKMSGWVHARRDHGKIIFIDFNMVKYTQFHHFKVYFSIHQREY